MRLLRIHIVRNLCTLLLRTILFCVYVTNLFISVTLSLTYIAIIRSFLRNHHNSANFRGEAAFQLTNELSEWLEKNDILPEYAEVLEQHGYFNLSFIAGLHFEVR